MRTISTPAWLFALLSAALQVLIFPTGGPVAAWRPMLCWIALAPFLLALVLPGKDGKPLTWRAAGLLGYACGILWYAGNCFWIYQTMYLYGGLPKPVSFGIVILFSLYLGLYHGLFAILLSLIHRSGLSSRWMWALAPVVWVAVELARARITGFPWDLLGNAQVDNLLLTRLAPITGVMGLSFVIAAVNAGLAAGVLAKGRQRLLLLAASVLIAAALQIAGAIPSLVPPQQKADQLAIFLQENLAVGATGREVKPLSQAEELDTFTEASLHPLTPSSPELAAPWTTPTLIVWPEAPSHLQSNDPIFLARMAALAQQAHAPLIIGSLGVDLTREATRGYYLYDSASLFDAAGTYTGRYDKIHLVPWGEYIPFKQFFSFAQKLTEGVGDMDRGHERTVFRTAGHSYGVFVCYESIFGDEVRQFAINGAEVLVNISDDGWYGDTGAPWQHLNMARMRAIENHRWVLRATNTGVTTAIDPEGRITVEAPRYQRAAYAFHFGFEQGTTFYTRHGDWFAYLCAALTLAALAVALTRRRLE